MTGHTAECRDGSKCGGPHCPPTAAPTMPRRVTTRCPRCHEDIELNVSTHTRLTFGSGSGHKGWITMEVGVSAIEHVCDDRLTTARGIQ